VKFKPEIAHAVLRGEITVDAAVPTAITSRIA
jgi:hypothetical protein